MFRAAPTLHNVPLPIANSPQAAGMTGTGCEPKRGIDRSSLVPAASARFVSETPANDVQNPQR